MSAHAETRRSFTFGFDRFSGLYLWALAIAVFGIWTPQLFLSEATAVSIATGSAIAAMLAMAVLIPITAGSFDLSIGATINLSAVVGIVLQSNEGWSMGAAMAVAIACGIAVGIVNGFLVVKLHIDSLIATLGMASVVEAAQIIISSNMVPAPPASTTWSAITQTEVLGFPVLVFYLLALAVIVWWLLERTPGGRYLYAIGGNADAARLSGVRVGKWRWLALIASGTICGVAGVLYGSYTGPSLTFGAALLLPAFAAVFLGSTQIRPGHFNVWGTIIAVYVLATGVKGLQLVTGVQWLNEMFNGLALIAAVGFATGRQRQVARARSTGGRRLRRPGATPRDGP